MLEHPGTELQVLIREKGLTQKAFASVLGKKVSEVNELLKGKRNITIQRDYLLHQTLGTPIKYWILKQIDYDYSLLDIEESNEISLNERTNKTVKNDLSGTKNEKAEETGDKTDFSSFVTQSNNHNITDSSEIINKTPSIEKSTPNEVDKSSQQNNLSKYEEPINTSPLSGTDNSSHQTNYSENHTEESKEIGSKIVSTPSNPVGQIENQEVANKEINSKTDEDLKNRAKIFRSF